VSAGLTIGTAGHIDHGKTALVRALTGIDTDRLPEERRRGISIELGYAPLVLGCGTTLSVVDVPGHERFIATMVAGASGIDVVLIVVACDDGVMPQTREHVAICALLGIERSVVVLSKRDLVDEIEADLARTEVRELLAGTVFASAEIIECSVADPASVERVRTAIARATEGLGEPERPGSTRLAVDRASPARSGRGASAPATSSCWRPMGRMRGCGRSRYTVAPSSELKPAVESPRAWSVSTTAGPGAARCWSCPAPTQKAFGWTWCSRRCRTAQASRRARVFACSMAPPTYRRGSGCWIDPRCGPGSVRWHSSACRSARLPLAATG
jgi:small GTP-binding protein